MRYEVGLDPVVRKLAVCMFSVGMIVCAGISVYSLYIERFIPFFLLFFVVAIAHYFAIRHAMRRVEVYQNYVIYRGVLTRKWKIPFHKFGTPRKVLQVSKLARKPIDTDNIRGYAYIFYNRRKRRLFVVDEFMENMDQLYLDVKEIAKLPRKPHPSSQKTRRRRR